MAVVTVEPLSLGPIVGAIAPNGVNIWGRGEIGTKDQLLLARLKKLGASDEPWSDPHVGEIDPYYDYAGVVRIDEGLEPDTDYEFQAGRISGANRSAFFRAREEAVWQAGAYGSGRFRTAPADRISPVNFVLGSCRNLGGVWNGMGLRRKGRASRLAEKPFELILDWLAEEDPPRFNLLTGDQVYADKRGAALFGRARISSFEEYAETYRLAFGTEYYRRCLAQLGNYMIFDDHDIQNNWAFYKYRDSEDGGKRSFDLARFRGGIRAYEAYQVIHGPQKPLQDVDQYGRRFTKYWYRFEYGCSAFFVMDVRGEQDTHGLESVVSDPEKEGQWAPFNREPEMIGGKQLDALLEWLEDQPDERIKFIVSPVPLFPDTTGRWIYSGEPADKWAGFCHQRQRILDHIRDNEIQRVVVLSGDVHCAYVARLEFGESENKTSFSVHQVVSSAIHWPVPGLRAGHFPHRRLSKIEHRTENGATQRRAVPGPYFIEMLTQNAKTKLSVIERDKKAFHLKNNIARIKATREGITVKIFHPKRGKCLETVRIDFKSTTDQ